MHELAPAQCLQLNEACTAVPDGPLGSRLRSWRAEQINPLDCIVELDASGNELQRISLVRAMQNSE